MGKVTVGYRYLLGMHLGLCKGPVDAVLEARSGDRTFWLGNATANTTLSINQPELHGGDEKEGGLQGTLDIMMGAPGQVPNPYLLQQHGPNTPAYRGILSVVWWRGLLSANNPYIKPWAFKVRRIAQGWQGGTPWYAAKAAITLPGGIGQAMNPAHIVYEALTNGEWGMGYGSSLIDDANFRAAADALHAEGFGLCMLWTQQQPIESFVQTVLDHTGANLVQDRSSGLFKLKLLRADYTPASLPLFDESNILTLDSYQRPALPDAVNEITVKFDDLATGKPGSVAVQNLANITAQGGTVTQGKAYPGLPTSELASRVALRDLRAVSTAIARVRFTANRAGAALMPGDVIRFSWEKLGIATMVLRVLRVNTGTVADGRVDIEAAEDVFGLPATSYAAQQPIGWSDPSTLPAAATNRVVREANYYEVLQQLGSADTAALAADASFVVAAASRLAGDAIDFGLRIKLDSASAYEEEGRAPFAPTGELQSALSHTATSATLVNMVDTDLVTVGGYAQLGTELVRVEAFNATTGAITLGRAVCGTVAKAHSAGARLYFLDGFLANDSTERIDGEQVNVKLTPRTGRGELTEAAAPTDTLTMDGVPARPYPPGQFRIGGQAYPVTAESLALSWVHRDRLQQNLEGDESASIGPEAGTSYSLEVRDGGTNALLHAQTNILGTSYTPPGISAGSRRVVLWSVRGGLASHQAHDWTFAYIPPVVAPGAAFVAAASFIPGLASDGNGNGASALLNASARILRGAAFSEAGGDVLLLLRMEGSNGSTTFVDSSVWAASTTALNGTQITTTDPRFGVGALTQTTEFADATPPGLRVGSAGTTPSHFVGFFNLTNWTVEGWAYLVDTGEPRPQYSLFALDAVDGSLAPIGSRIGFKAYSSGATALVPFIAHGTVVTEANGSLVDGAPFGQWFHFAFVKRGSELRCFINGVNQCKVFAGGGVVQEYIAAGTSTAPNTSTVHVGRGGESSALNGKLDEVRITRFARYVDDFTPPSAAFPDPPAFSGIAPSNIVLLMHMDGADASTAFVDSSLYVFPATGVGSAQIDTAQSKFGGASLLLDGSGDVVTVPHSAELNLGTGDFTIEFWIRPSAVGTSYACAIGLSNSTSGPALYMTGPAGRPLFYLSGVQITHQNALVAGQWSHLALVRQAGVLAIYLDGVKSTATYNYASALPAVPLSIGAATTAAAEAMGGHIDELRIVKGQAVYSVDFTPPAAPFPNPVSSDAALPANVQLLLHMEGADASTTFTDSSSYARTATALGNAQVDTAQAKFTAASALFDRSGDAIRFDDTTGLRLGSGDWTIECWIRPTVMDGTEQTIAMKGTNLGSALNYEFRLNTRSSGTSLLVSNGSTNYGVFGSSPLPAANAWTHIAAVRDGNTLRLFVNGVQQAGGTEMSGAVNGDAGAFYIGARNESGSLSEVFSGHIDEFRFTKGQALYTANFTPPAAPFPNP